MKSLREWILENDQVSAVSMRDVLGGSGVQVNMELKNKLKPKLIQIMNENENEDPMNLLREIIAVSASIIGNLKGTRIPTSKILDLVNSMPQEGGEENAPQVP